MNQADFDRNFADRDDTPDYAAPLKLVPEKVHPLPITCMADLHGKLIPPREWIIQDWIPANAVTLVAGGGATGKSLLIQQLLVCTALGLPCLSMPASAPTPTLFINCEDETLELERRNRDICDAIGVEVRECADVYTISRLGELGNELGTFDDRRTFQLSAFFRTVEATAFQCGARVIGLDNIGHLFTGNENDRGEVTQFANALSRLAMRINGAVILLGHPAKVEGSQYSGSTAWENAVRSRLFLSRPEGAGEQALDDDARILTRGKANYSAKGAALEMRWHKGAFVPPEPETDDPYVDPGSNAGKHNAAFLKCLAVATDQLRAVSHKPNSGTYAPRIFAQMPAGKGVSKHDFALAMERLLGMKTIAVDQNLWVGKDRHTVTGVARCG